MSTARTDSSTPPGTPRGTSPGGNTDRRGGGLAGESEPMRFIIPSDLQRGREVQSRILAACRDVGFDEDAYFAVKLALDEAVTNAIRHGNGLDPDKQVEVVAQVTPRQIHVEIRDEGPGFDRDGVPDPTLAENLDKCSGRGLLLIEAYMSDVSWSQDGRTIRMTKYNTPEPPGKQRSDG